MLDTRCRGTPTEAYKQYAAGRSDRPSSVASYCGGWKGNTADDILLVDQGTIALTGNIRSANYLIMSPLDYDFLMEQALSEARKGLKKGEVPIGAVLAGSNGEIVARSYNQPISLKDPTAHAEILTLRSAGSYYSNYRLNGTTLVVTIEPCAMCMGAAIHGRISRLVYGAPDPKGGAAGSLFNLAVDLRLNHKIEVISGIREKECSRLLQDFFLKRRSA